MKKPWEVALKTMFYRYIYPMNLIPLTIKGISSSQIQTGAYALILSEPISNKKLPIIIGSFEAQSIAIALEKDIKAPRPLTHDLFKNMASTFGITISRVVIEKLIDGVFHSSVYLRREGIEHPIDSRTSDAVALAVRFNAPIFTTKEILEKAAFEFERRLEGDAMEKPAPTPKATSTERENKGDKESLGKRSKKELEEIMQRALSKEDYELAAKVRDELEKRRLK